MLTIGQLAKTFSLSRSTLLYYDRIGLLRPSGRNEASYRLYSEQDVERLQSICAYRDAGLTLAEVGEILDNLESPQRQILEKRLLEIGQNIQTLQQQQQLLARMLKIKASNGPFHTTGKQLWVDMFRAAGMDETAMRNWHREFELQAPDDHHAFLLALDISEKEVIQIRKLSANMASDQQQSDFFYQLYEQVERCAPSSNSETRRALSLLPDLPPQPRVLDVGCGNGAQTLVLAEQLQGQIVAIDNHQPFLDRLLATAKHRKLKADVMPQPASMFALPFAEQSFDLIWAEGSIYIVGFNEGLKQWRPLLEPGGALVLTELTWLKQNPPQEILNYWRKHYPDMTDVAQRLTQAEAAGYRLIDHFTLPSEAWSKNYYAPLRERIASMREEFAWNETAEKVFAQTEEEADMYDRFGEWYGYEFILLQKPGEG